MVANFVSVSSFTLRGVVIDASTASFTGGTAAQLANGVFLEVHGTVANNVVHATTVQLIAITPGQAPDGSVIQGGGGGMMGGRGMMGGSRVNVSVQLTGGQYLATAISLIGG